MRSGFGEIKKTVEKQKAGFTPPTGKLNYFSLDAGEVVVVRFLDDEPVTAKFYEWIINNQGKTSEFICAPDLYQYDPDWKGEDWVKKWTSDTPGIGWTKKYKSDELILPKLADRTVGIAVLQEADPDNPGKYRDVLEQIESEGEQVIALHFMLVRQALSNFWDQMVGYHGLYGTICDRPYRIERKGGDVRTTYQAIGLNPDPDWNYDGSSLQALQAYYGYGVKLKQEKDDNGKVTGVSVTKPEGAAFEGTDYTWENRHLYCPQTVKDWCANRASEEFAEYWLNPNAEHLSDKPAAKGVSAEQLAATRPTDPRKQSTATPVATAPAPAVAAAAAPPGNKEFAEATTSNPDPVAAASAPAEPISGDRFEEMRKKMAERQATASK